MSKATLGRLLCSLRLIRWNWEIPPLCMNYGDKTMRREKVGRWNHHKFAVDKGMAIV